MREDIHYRCPTVEIREPWVQHILRAWNYSVEGAPVRDIEPSPAPSLFDGLLVLRAEIDDREKQRAKDMDADRTAAAEAEAAAKAAGRPRG